MVGDFRPHPHPGFAAVGLAGFAFLGLFLPALLGLASLAWRGCLSWFGWFWLGRVGWLWLGMFGVAWLGFARLDVLIQFPRHIQNPVVQNQLIAHLNVAFTVCVGLVFLAQIVPLGTWVLRPSCPRASISCYGQQCRN